MSYSHQNIDAWLTPPTGALLSALTDPAAAVVPLRPGYQPIMPVAVYALIVTQPTTTPPVIVFKFRPTLGSPTGEIVIGTLTVPLATVAGIMLFKTVDNVKCTPGGEIVATITTAAAAGAAQLGLLLSPNWDSPGNNLKMVRSV
jgi:hypothetical protein